MNQVSQMNRSILSFSLAVAIALSPVTAVGADPAGSDSGSGRVRRVLERIGLFRSGPDIDAIDGSGDIPFATVLPPAGDDEFDAEPGTDSDPVADLNADPSQPGEPFVAPIPFRSPSLGWGGALAGGYIFRIDPDDRDSPPSTASLAGFATENESYGGFVSFKGHLAEDRWRIVIAGGFARVNYDFFGIGSDAGEQGFSVEIDADAYGGQFEVIRKLPTESLGTLGKNLYLGPSVRFTITDNDVELGIQLPPGFENPDFDETNVALGLHLQRDTRDDKFYPETGSLTDFSVDFYDRALGGDFDFRIFDFAFNRYHSLWTDGVLAWRAIGRFAEGDVPFTNLSQHDLRGYERGRYRDKVHVAGEIEIRQHLFWRVGAVAFAGLGQIAPTIGDLDGDQLLWSAGLGVRFRLTDENRMNYRTDFGWGRNGFEFYFSLTEEF